MAVVLLLLLLLVVVVSVWLWKPRKAMDRAGVAVPTFSQQAAMITRL